MARLRTHFAVTTVSLAAVMPAVPVQGISVAPGR